MKSRVIKPPAPIEGLDAADSVFLAGSIEMGKAEKWQDLVEHELSYDGLIILNPRRDDWDASWEQSAGNPEFLGQVEWELEGQHRADIIAMYFSPGTKSPITLLELGLFARSGKLIVCCPPGFWRRSNVEIVCSRYDVKMVDHLACLVMEIRKSLRN